MSSMTTTPKILGFDYTISLDFLREGDEFLAFDPKTRFFRHGVANMDGHGVSEHYGVRAGNTYYFGHPEKNYINVKWSDMTYAWPSFAGKFHTEVDGVWQGPNSTINETEGLVILVRLDVSRRVSEDMDINQTAEKKERLMAEALAEVEAAQAALAKAKKKVQEANRL